MLKKLPKADHKLGYPKSQLKKICKQIGVKYADLRKAIGVVTGAVDDKTGETLIYGCDIESGLHRLGHKLGKWHPWD